MGNGKREAGDGTGVRVRVRVRGAGGPGAGNGYGSVEWRMREWGILAGGRGVNVDALMVDARMRTGVRIQTLRLLVFGIVLGCAVSVRGGEATLVEPIVEENITDLDATAIGTIEADLSGSAMKPRNAERGGNWTSELEAEWRPIDRIGIGAALVADGQTSGLWPTSVRAVTPRAAVSYVSLRDERRKLFLQWEVSGRYPDDGVTDATESALPFDFGVRWATELGPFTFRSGAFLEAGAAFATLPFRQSYAALVKCLNSPVRVHLGAEFIEDWARSSPVLA